MEEGHGGVLVTGAASGIGRAVADRFLEQGTGVVAMDLNPNVTQDMPAESSRLGQAARLRSVQGDVSSEGDVEAAVKEVIDNFGHIRCVVNNAGVGGAFGPLIEIDVDDWDYTFAVLTRGTFLGTKHGARAMREQGSGGVIVNTASIAGLSAGAGPQAYSSAKAAVINFGRVAAAELAPDHIRVNNVCPGVVFTPLLGRTEEEAKEVLEDVQPWPEPELPGNVADVIVFLASEKARFITGETISVDGGITAAGPRLGDSLGGNPGLRGLVGVNRGSTGERSTVRHRVSH